MESIIKTLRFPIRWRHGAARRRSRSLRDGKSPEIGKSSETLPAAHPNRAMPLEDHFGAIFPRLVLDDASSARRVLSMYIDRPLVIICAVLCAWGPLTWFWSARTSEVSVPRKAPSSVWCQLNSSQIDVLSSKLCKDKTHGLLRSDWGLRQQTHNLSFREEKKCGQCSTHVARTYIFG